MLFATVPLAPPTRKNQRTTSCPAPISANEPYQRLSRLMLSAFWCVFSFSSGMGTGFGEAKEIVERDGGVPWSAGVLAGQQLVAKRHFLAFGVERLEFEVWPAAGASRMWIRFLTLQIRCAGPNA